MSKKTEIQNTIKDYINSSYDSNHHLMRYARCYFDGSYNDYKMFCCKDGQDFYSKNIKTAKENPDFISESLAFNLFCHYLAVDFKVDPQYARKVFLDFFPKDKLSDFKKEIFEDLKDIYNPEYISI